MREQAQNIE